MLTHLLDTSAWIAHIQGERGSEMISGLLSSEEFRVGISTLSLIELHGRLRSFKREQEFIALFEDYRDLFAQIMPVDEAVALRTTILRKTAGVRLPAVDAIIAATAAHHNAVLVHRDAHFTSIPGEHLRQEMLVAGS